MATSKALFTARTRLQKKHSPYSKHETEKRWKRARGLLKGRIRINPVAWQRQVRKDEEAARVYYVC